jgi:hypothetical protein
MKKLLILALGLLPMLPLSGQNRVVEVARITETTTPPTVTFRVYWDAAPDNLRHRDSVWLFVDYQTVDNAGVAGPWTAATLSGASVTGAGTLSVVANTRGFYLNGTAAPFSSTVTVALDGLTPAGTKFNWCAYASDYPPNATENNGYYDLHGSSPFVINGNITEPSKTYTGGCIETLTDATGCPGEVPMLPEVLDFTASTAAVCPGGSVTLTASANSVTTEFSFDGGTVWIPATPAGTATGATTSVAPTGTTDYTVLVRSLAGCTRASTVTHTVTILPLPAPSFSNAPASVCAGSSVTVVATGGGSYCFTHTCSNCIHNPYTTGNDLSSEVDCDMSNTSCSFSPSNSYTFTMPESGSVTVSVVVENSSGCTATIDTTITVCAPPAAPILTGGGVYCSNSATLTCFGETGYSYQLQNSAITPVGAAQTGANAPLNFPVTAAGTYTVVTTVPGCSATSNPQTISITTAMTPGAITTASYISCNNTVGTATAVTTPATGNYRYQWTVAYNGGAATAIDGATAETYLPPATPTAGTYVYRRQVANNCTFSTAYSSGTVTRRVYLPLSPGSISGSGMILEGVNCLSGIEAGVPASGASGTYTYRWIREGTPGGTYNVNSASYTFTSEELNTAGTYVYYREVHDNTCNPSVWTRASGSYVLTISIALTCPYTGTDRYEDGSHICQRRATGAHNWEAWIQDARDGKIYRIAQLCTSLWTMDDYLDYEDHPAVIPANDECSAHDPLAKEYWRNTLAATHSSLCPDGWRLPTQIEFEQTVTDWTQCLSKVFVLTGERTTFSNWCQGGYISFLVIDCLGAGTYGQRLYSINPVTWADGQRECANNSYTYSGYARCVRNL